MEYLLDIDKIKSHHLIFKLPIKNQNIKYKHYYKLLYSDHNIHLKYILLKMNFQMSYVEHHDHFYKMKVSKQDPIFNKIKALEEMILKCLNNSIKKKMVLCCYQDILAKDILFQSSYSQDMFLKISGIWEDETHIGLVYKFYYMMSTEKLSNMIC